MALNQVRLDSLQSAQRAIDLLQDAVLQRDSLVAEQKVQIHEAQDKAVRIERNAVLSASKAEGQLRATLDADQAKLLDSLELAHQIVENSLREQIRQGAKLNALLQSQISNRDSVLSRMDSLNTVLSSEYAALVRKSEPRSNKLVQLAPWIALAALVITR